MTLIMWGLQAQVGLGFAHAEVGDTIEPFMLKAVDGIEYPFITDGFVNVFVFIDPGKDYSRRAIRQIVDLEKILNEDSVKWTIILSDRFSVEDYESILEEENLTIRMLIDEADELYGQLGVALFPAIGIVDEDRVLRHYLPFRKINYQAVIGAAVKEVLGKISPEEFELIVFPSSTIEEGKSRLRKGARLGLAKRLMENGDLSEAEKQVKLHLEDWPEDPDGQELLTAILDLISEEKIPPK